jgi:hypothetical protein
MAVKIDQMALKYLKVMKYLPIPKVSVECLPNYTKIDLQTYHVATLMYIDSFLNEVRRTCCLTEVPAASLTPAAFDFTAEPGAEEVKWI